MRLATWNVNSIRTRVARTVEFAVREDIDVLAMQEVKCKPEQFPYGPFEDAGYHVEVHGLNQWNGVAIASRLPITDVQAGFPGMPGFAKGATPDAALIGDGAPLEARALGAMIEGVKVWSLYVPNGRSLTDAHYTYKLQWLDALRRHAASELQGDPELPLAFVGDFNIIPFDSDNGDPDIVEGVSTHVSPQERAAFFALQDAGMTDVVRPLIPSGYTYWDYQRLKFPRDEGIRIDFVLGSPTFAEQVTAAAIHRDERKGEQPSDHVPVVVELDRETSDDDDLPMIFG
ncbi:exodeoxyribonuclease III [Microbacterium sp. NIBRBAC000506063]|uniref:exodeoxyribonuclease III n=1 Tax=Microbacterium sp. NIBRBAC000506063 TaxID=2734618 RepID=UPI001BB503EB|nr:exodeoxyribonuclease III [Microbacterium sp. NIBRBAC000506063]QTV80284.1 exodeoxyribonuclease III [Microbacterium sp. NIBRBAC000506063]